MSGSITKFPLGFYSSNPNGSDAGANATFETNYDSFAGVMGARPQFMDSFVDFSQDPSQWAANAGWSAWSWAQTGNAYVGPGSGTTPVVGVPMASNADGWGNADTFYQQIAAGQYDADYAGIVDAWAGRATRRWTSVLATSSTATSCPRGRATPPRPPRTRTSSRRGSISPTWCTPKARSRT